MEGSRVIFNFNPLLLLTSPDYGLTYCFMTPVFLFLLILPFVVAVVGLWAELIRDKRDANGSDVNKQ
jgi:hypothetical protein